MLKEFERTKNAVASFNKFIKTPDFGYPKYEFVLRAKANQYNLALTLYKLKSQDFDDIVELDEREYTYMDTYRKDVPALVVEDMKEMYDNKESVIWGPKESNIKL